MAYLGKGRKEDFKIIVVELGDKLNDNMRIIDLYKLNTKSVNYEEVFIRKMLSTVINKRIGSEEESERAGKEKIKADERNFN